jgi:hypothetical protein
MATNEGRISQTLSDITPGPTSHTESAYNSHLRILNSRPTQSSVDSRSVQILPRWVPTTSPSCLSSWCSTSANIFLRKVSCVWHSVRNSCINLRGCKGYGSLRWTQPTNHQLSPGFCKSQPQVRTWRESNAALEERHPQLWIVANSRFAASGSARSLVVRYLFEASSASRLYGRGPCVQSL